MDELTWAGLGSVLQGVGTIGGAWAGYDAAQKNNRIQKKMLKAEEQRLNRDQQAQRNMAKAFGATEEELDAYNKNFNFA
jgi:hypothetical protein